VPPTLKPKKNSTFHDFPYLSPERKCLRCWIINVTPPGPQQCVHNCLYCYAREAVYSNYSADTQVYSNLAELVEKDLDKMALCPPISLSNVSDPCQNIPELKTEVKRLILVLIRRGVTFFITTKGDPSFLLDVPGFADYERKAVAITIEGTPDMIELLSPGAPSFDLRVQAVRKLTGLGVFTTVRLDPFFLHLARALHHDSWWRELVRLTVVFASAGARHLIAGTGRLSKRRNPLPDHTSTWERVQTLIQDRSPSAANEFSNQYVYEPHWSGGGYRLRRHLRLEFHHALRQEAETRGMTYAACQELAAAEADSEGIPNCEGMPLPFSRKGPDGRFEPVPGCTATCHVSCKGLATPPCGQPRLARLEPLTLSMLRTQPR